MLKYLIFDRGDTIIVDLPESYGGMANWPYYKPVEGVIETVSELSKSYSCVIASNTSISSSSIIRSALSKIKLDSCFSYIFTQSELGCAKPDKAFFLNILNFLNAKPFQTCMIGNSYKLDIVPAKEVGMHTILLSQKSGIYPKADYTINKFKELITIINKIN